MTNHRLNTTSRTSRPHPHEPERQWGTMALQALARASAMGFIIPMSLPRYTRSRRDGR